MAATCSRRTNRPNYRPEAAMAGWERILEFYGKNLAG